MARDPEIGAYVLATKYSDGDPGDAFCIGFLTEIFDHYGNKRFMVADNDGKQFRGNGFRRVQRISARRGAWLIERFPQIELERDVHSVWWWARQPMRLANDHAEGK